MARHRRARRLRVVVVAALCAREGVAVLNAADVSYLFTSRGFETTRVAPQLAEPEMAARDTCWLVEAVGVG
jgi:hypothetical protein